jgi:hypothetical protein
MSTIRSLESFSLSKLFKSIENDSRSGRLIVETPVSPTTTKRAGIYYIWFSKGHLIAVSDCLNQKGLIELIAQRGWLSPAIVSRLRTLCPTSVPLGTYLCSQNLLDRPKLSLIFQLQLHQVYRLFQLTEGRFRFDNFSQMQDRILTIPWLEMTGHRIKASEVTLYAMRLIENWGKFNHLLPESATILKRIVAEPHLKLATIERQVWNLTDSRTSISEIARATGESRATIKITAFRLMAVGLISTSFPDYQQHKSLKELASYSTQMPREIGFNTMRSTYAKRDLF